MNQDFITLIPWSLVFTLCNTLILFLLIKKFLFKPVNNMLEKRAEDVKSTYDAAEKAKNDAEALKQEYEQHLLSAKEEAGEIIKTASRKAQVRGEEIVNEAQTKAGAIMDKATTEIEREKKKAVNEIKDEISSMAIQIASKVVEREINETDHERLIEQFIDSVGEV